MTLEDSVGEFLWIWTKPSYSDVCICAARLVVLLMGAVVFSVRTMKTLFNFVKITKV